MNRKVPVIDRSRTKKKKKKSLSTKSPCITSDYNRHLKHAFEIHSVALKVSSLTYFSSLVL